MHLRLATLLLAALLAGCVQDNPAEAPAEDPVSQGDRRVPATPQDPYPAGDPSESREPAPTPPPARPGALRFGEPVVLDAHDAAKEPNLAVLPDGTVFVVAIGTPDSDPALLEPNVWLWRSRDGSTWDALMAPDGARSLPTTCATRYMTGDADVVADGRGTVYVADWWYNVGCGVPERQDQVVVVRSGDGGETWQTGGLSLPRNTVIDRPYLVAGDDGDLWMFFLQFHPGPNRIAMVHSDDGGETWGPVVEVVPPEDKRFPVIAHPVRLPDGTLVLPYGNNHHQNLHLGARTDIRLAVSTDGGASWEQRQFGYMPRGPDHLWPLQAAADDEGRILVAWARRDLGGMSLWSVQTRDAGQTWEDAQWLGYGGQHLMPWVAGSGHGFTVSWFSAAPNGTAHEMPDGTPWHVLTAHQPEAGAGLWVQQATDGPVWTGGLCAHPTCEGGRGLGDYQAVAHGPDGTVWFAHTIDHDGGPRIQVRSAVWSAAT